MVYWQYLTYFVIRAYNNLRENRFLSFVTIAVIAVSMLLFSTFLLMYHNISSALESWGHDVQVSAYLKDSIDPIEARQILVQIEAMTEVKKVEYVSKEEAMATFSQSLKGISGIIDDLGTNPLPASIEIELREGRRGGDAIQTFVQKINRPAFEDIDWSQEWVEKFYAFLNLLRWSGVLLGSLLAAASIFIISQTIRLGFFARKDEFEILELVGATPAFIRVPFVIEGFVQGLTGALAAEALLYIAYRTIAARLDTSLQASLGALSLEFLPPLDLLLIALAGMGLGLLGSLASIRKVVAGGLEP